MKIIVAVAVTFTMLNLGGCAATAPPSELVFARAAFHSVSAGQAQRLVPAEVQIAEEALSLAEQSFNDEPTSLKTRDLAYIAGRQAHRAHMLAVTAEENAATTVKISTEAMQATITRTLPVNRTASEQVTEEAPDRSAAEAVDFRAVDTRAAAALADLVTLAGAREDARGLVLTLSGSMLFASNRSDMSPVARERMNLVANALMITKDRRLTVEGHTDVRGSTEHNLYLSQKRADEVRTYLISRGYDGKLILATGLGDAHPIADNGTNEGRANNRHVEIIMDRPVVLKSR